MLAEPIITPELLAYLTNGEIDEDETSSIVRCMDDLVVNRKKELYFIMGYQNNTVELFGCPSREGLMALAAYFSTFLLTTPSILFKGVPYDPTELPYGLGAAELALVIFADHSMQILYRMAGAVKYIEDHIAKFSASSIEDFAVIIGKDLRFDREEWTNTVADTEEWKNAEIRG